MRAATIDPTATSIRQPQHNHHPQRNFRHAGIVQPPKHLAEFRALDNCQLVGLKLGRQAQAVGFVGLDQEAARLDIGEDVTGTGTDQHEIGCRDVVALDDQGGARFAEVTLQRGQQRSALPASCHNSPGPARCIPAPDG